jgi:hypothetical protein
MRNISDIALGFLSGSRWKLFGMRKWRRGESKAFGERITRKHKSIRGIGQWGYSIMDECRYERPLG